MKERHEKIHRPSFQFSILNSHFSISFFSVSFGFQISDFEFVLHKFYN